jgi:hypothetical protein
MSSESHPVPINISPVSTAAAAGGKRSSEVQLVQLEDTFHGLKSAYRQLQEQYLHAQEEVAEAKLRGDKWLQLKNKFQVRIIYLHQAAGRQMAPTFRRKFSKKNKGRHAHTIFFKKK